MTSSRMFVDAALTAISFAVLMYYSVRASLAQIKGLGDVFVNYVFVAVWASIIITYSLSLTGGHK